MSSSSSQGSGNRITSNSKVIDLTRDSPEPNQNHNKHSSVAFIPKNNTQNSQSQQPRQQSSNNYHHHQQQQQQIHNVAPRDKHSTSKVKMVDPSAFMPSSAHPVARQPLSTAANQSINHLNGVNNNQSQAWKPAPIPFFTSAQAEVARPRPPPVHLQQQYMAARQQPQQQFPSPPPISSQSYLNSSSPTRYPYQNPSISTITNRLEGDPLANEPEPSEWDPSGKTDLATTTKSLRELVFETVDLDDLDLEKANVEGMTCTLLPHQIIGVGWAVNREKGPNKGGLLADDMGLGKTVQMIGLIVQNHPKNQDSTILQIITPKEIKKKSKSKEKGKSRETEKDEDEPKKTKIKSHTTLILAPVAVLKQWSDEIKSKTQGLSVMIHHDKTKVKNASEFKKYDVVISSYTTAAAEWKHTKEGKDYILKKEANKRAKKGGPIEDEEDQNRNQDQKEEKSKNKNESDDELSSDSDSDDTLALKKKLASKSKKPSLTPLFDGDWLRIIADEAQNIKNKDTNGAQASFLLSKNSISRWCLTGTPIQNSAMELFSLIHFLRMPPFNDFKHFKEKISDPLNSSNATRSFHGMKRLRFVLETFMLRRPKTAEIDGKPLITLPKRNVSVIKVEFDDESEREFYISLENLIKSNIEKASEKSENGKINHVMVLTGLMRLRQACNHPSLCSKLILEDIAAMKAEDKESDSNGPSPSTSSKDINIKTNINNITDDDDEADELADLFSKVTVERKCRNCEEILDSETIPKDQIICKNCKKLEKKIMEKGIDWFDSKKSSTKIRMILKILNGVKEKGLGEKTIVFSQFTSFLNLLEPFLEDENLKFVRYDGTMKNQDREVVLEKIRKSSSTNIILISFKAGSTGLNLTCCNHVILSDLWWNPQIEEQAFDRAHRFGQQKDVFIHKLSLINTVEERILALQEKKRALSNAALEGTKLKKSKDERADMRFLMGMFGAEI